MKQVYIRYLDGTTEQYPTDKPIGEILDAAQKTAQKCETAVRCISYDSSPVRLKNGRK